LRFKSFDARGNLRIKNALAAVAAANITGVPQNAIAGSLRNSFAVKPVGHEMSSAVQGQVGSAQLQELLHVLPRLAQRLRPALRAIASDVAFPFWEETLLSLIHQLLHSIEQTEFNQKPVNGNYAASSIRFQIAQVLQRNTSSARIKRPEIEIKELVVGPGVSAFELTDLAGPHAVRIQIRNPQ
jgi:hypothetical protein